MKTFKSTSCLVCIISDNMPAVALLSLVSQSIAVCVLKSVHIISVLPSVSLENVIVFKLYH